MQSAVRKALIILFFLWLSDSAMAQEYGAQWVIGFNTSILDFRTSDTVKLDTIAGNMADFLTLASICDAKGNLLYFTNGIYIADKNGDSLPNGNGLSPCAFTDYWKDDGLNIQQGAIFIPKPGDTAEYILIHFSRDTDNEGFPGTLYYTEIRDSGLGYVVKKNTPFGKGIFRSGGVTGCKHANGRDYWVVMGMANSNEYYKYLFTPDSIIGPFIQDIGPFFGGSFDLPSSKFSLDGTLYATGIYGFAPIVVMDFDRCSGEFSNPVTIFNNVSADTTIDTISGCASIEFSPNGQMLYVTTSNNLAQFNLTSLNIQDSVNLYHASDTDFFMISTLQTAPNGKLYASTWNGGAKFIHVINYPNKNGDSCNFIYGGQPTLSLNCETLPNLTNYKLGPLIGSGCDTIVDTTTAVKAISGENDLLRLLPNPANKYVYVEMGRQGDYELQLLNENGELIDKRETRQVDIFDTERLASGVYFVKAVDKNNSAQSITKKVVIQH